MFWKQLKCLLFGHDEKLQITGLERHPVGGYTVTRSRKFCWRCRRPL